MENLLNEVNIVKDEKLHSTNFRFRYSVDWKVKTKAAAAAQKNHSRILSILVTAVGNFLGSLYFAEIHWRLRDYVYPQLIEGPASTFSLDWSPDLD